MADSATSGAVDSSGKPASEGTGRAVLRWLGWTALLCAIYWGSGALVRPLLGEDGAAPVLITFAFWVAGTFLIGMVYRSKAWPLSPLAVGIGAPIVVAILAAILGKVTGTATPAVITLVSLVSLLGLAPLAVILAGIGWLGVFVGNRRAAKAEAPGTPIAAGEPDAVLLAGGQPAPVPQASTERIAPPTA